MGAEIAQPQAGGDVLADLAAVSPDLLCAVDRSGTFVAVNPAWERVVGWQATELVGRRFDAFLDPDDRQRTATIWVDQVLTGVVVTGFENRWRCPDGSRRWVSWSARLDPSRGLVVCSGRDITEQRRLQDSLRRDAEVHQTAADRLRRIDLLKSSFLSAISHELRTPLAVIHGMAQTLHRTRDELTPDARRPLEEALLRHTGRLSALLTDLLDVDRLMRGTLQVRPEPVEVVSVVSEWVGESTARGRLVLEAPPTLHARVDPVQMGRIVSNLLDNADKYAPEGTVTLAVEPLGADGFRLRLSDQGPGLDPSALDRVFEPFHRETDDPSQPGTGIGLALVAAFAALHGGRAWAEPVAPRGLCVALEIPPTHPIEPSGTGPTGRPPGPRDRGR